MLPQRLTRIRDNQSSIAVHQNRTRDRAYPIFFGHWRFAALSVINQGPSHIVLFSKLQQLRAFSAAVQTHAYDFEPLVMKLLIRGHDIWDFLAARPAPRRPKIQQYHLPFEVIREIDAFSIDSSGLEGWRWLPTRRARSAAVSPGWIEGQQTDGGQNKKSLDKFFHNQISNDLIYSERPT